jgi:hypothetical protein
MSTNAQLTETEAAMIALLKDDPEVQSWKPTIKTAATQDFTADGTMLTIPPSILFAYDSMAARARDPRATVYDRRQTWSILIWVQNLRGSAEAKIGAEAGGKKEVGAYEMLDRIAEILAGARLNLESSQGSKPLVELGDNQIVAFQPRGIQFRQEVTVITDHVRP